MDVSTNKSFLAGALSALSGQSIVAPKDAKTDPDPMEMGSVAKALAEASSPMDAGSRIFSMDSLHKHTLQWVGDSQKVAGFVIIAAI